MSSGKRKKLVGEPDYASIRSFLDALKVETAPGQTPPSKVPPSGESLDEKIQKEKGRKAQIENDIREKDQNLKTLTLKLLFIFLGFETFAAFVLAFLQGFNAGNFNLDPWSLRLLVGATLLQTVGMLTIAIKHLFPQKQK